MTIEIQHESSGYVCIINGDVKARGVTIEEVYRFAWTYVRLSSEPTTIWLPPLLTTTMWY